MAQSQRRMIYSKIWASPQFGKLSLKAQLLYIGTITLADDDGRLVGTSSYLRGQVFPFEDDLSVKDVINLREEVQKVGLINVYKWEDLEYIEHPKWLDYQVIRGDLYKQSTLPSRNGFVTKSLRKRDVSKDKLSKDKLIQRADDYLLNIPLEDLKEFTERFEATPRQIKSKGEDLLNYCKSKEKFYKDYKAFLLNALKKDFTERPPKKEASPPPKVENEATPEQRKQLAEYREQLKKDWRIKDYNVEK